mgnify:CR=1 FL=1
MENMYVLDNIEYFSKSIVKNIPEGVVIYALCNYREKL